MRSASEADDMKDPQTEPGLSRRAFITGLGAAASLPLPGSATAWAQRQSNTLLPLNTPKVDHLDVIVPNVEASARFYMGVFNTRLHAQPFQGGFRYFILLGDLPASRLGRISRHRRLARARHVHRSLLYIRLRVPPRQRGDFVSDRGGGRQGRSGQAVRRRRDWGHLLGP
jgi:catechol 2,3-dioxygenase-like lactoylglutathione lyase family enzyme